MKRRWISIKYFKNEFNLIYRGFVLQENIEEEKSVRLFHDDTFQSFYRRLSFSPDGELLAVPSGVLEIDGETQVENCTYIFSKHNLNKYDFVFAYLEFQQHNT